MKAFNLYWKIFRKQLTIVLSYVIIFLAITIANTTSSNQNNLFQETKVDIVVTNLDEGSALSEALIIHLTNYANIQEIDEENIKDALFFRKIQVAITIPSNFESDFLSGNNPLIIQEKIEQSISTVTIDNAINKYLNYVKVYLNQTEKTLSEVISLVDNVMKNKIETTSLNKVSDLLVVSGFYFRFVSYVICAVILLVVGVITISIRKFEVKRRLISSPYPQRKFNLEILLGNLIFVIIFVSLFGVIGLMLYKEALLNINGILLFVNIIAFGISVLCMAYFICMLIRKEQVLSGVNNVFSLGTAFISGAFVPQWLLGKGILTFAHILPNYYYVCNVDLITSTSTLTSANVNKVILYIVIQLLFAFAFIVASLLLNKKQAKAEH